MGYYRTHKVKVDKHADQNLILDTFMEAAVKLMMKRCPEPSYMIVAAILYKDISPWYYCNYVGETPTADDFRAGLEEMADRIECGDPPESWHP